MVLEYCFIFLFFSHIDAPIHRSRQFLIQGGHYMKSNFLRQYIYILKLVTKGSKLYQCLLQSLAIVGLV